MEGVARIVLALEAPELAEEVMHFLDRTGRARVVATAADGAELSVAVRRHGPDAVVASPALARGTPSLDGSALLVLETSESVPALREALRAGARGFFVWPAERAELAGAAARALPPAERRGSKRALVLAAYGPRGGVGTTFLATHLAAAFARSGRDTVLIDMDPTFGDVAGALGAPVRARTVADLAPVVQELSPRHLEEALWRHPEGFRALLGPPDAGGAETIGPSHYRAALDLLRSSVDVVVLHLARALGDLSQAGLGMADRILLVLSLDVLALRAARRALDLLGRMGLGDRCELVVNRAGRGELLPRDVERVFGRRPTAVLPMDRDVPSLQDRGRLLSRRGRTARAVSRLAERLLEAAR